ncbi:N-terminal asparagine amidohydrolase, partial [Paramuricea clavata]
MPLYVGKRVVGTEIRSSAGLLQNFPELEKRSREFAFQAQRTFQEKNILYIGQHEYGTVYPNDNFVDVVGSDSATTCQIVVLRHKGTGACSLAHFDGSGIPKALAAMVETLKEHAQNHGEHRIEMYIVGGFLDSRNISEDVFMQILRGAYKLAVDIDLLCACVCQLNDTMLNGKHVPSIYGIGVVVSSGEVVPVHQFNCQIPDEILRHVALYSEQKEVVQVYSSRTQEVTVKPFHVYYPSERARGIASLSDENILQ